MAVSDMVTYVPECGGEVACSWWCIILGNQFSSRAEEVNIRCVMCVELFRRFPVERNTQSSSVLSQRIAEEADAICELERGAE